ncbi:MAG: LacI family DNA-binding transcriptional regulator [Rhodobacteraceae bacterium]|nr:LacI family DNA-binding transcriptional regulator [Paracoccaceae bacterium]
MGKPTVYDIAKEAGVSLATVDRALNARLGVRKVTVQRVQEAVQKLGYIRDISAANLARQRRYKFVFLLPDTPSLFLQGLRDAITEASVGLVADRSEILTVQVAYQDPVALMKVFSDIEQMDMDGVAVMGNETPMMRDMIARLKARGVAVVAWVTDQPNSERDHFVGIDNIAAGRTAGMLMGRFSAGCTGKIVMVVNTMQSRDMVERRMGFDEVIAAHFPNLETLPSVEGRDDHARTAKVTAQCIAGNDNIVGLYCIGAGMRGVTQVLKEQELGDKLIVVAHDLTEHSKAELESGLVDVIINQNVGHLARSATRILRAQCDGVDVITSQEKIRIEIVIRENLP